MYKIVFLTGFIILLIVGFKAFSRDEVKEVKVSNAIHTASEVAALTAKFVDNSLSSTDDSHALFHSCSASSKECVAQNDPLNPPHMGYAIMSLGEVGEKQNDTRLIEKSRLLLDSSIERCDEDYRYCEWNFFPLHEYYKKTGDEKYLNAMLKVSESVMAQRPVRELIGNNLPVKWWRFYDATNEPQYLEALTSLADAQLETYPTERLNDDVIYTDNGVDIRTYDLPIIWALYMPAYQASKDEKYLTPVISFFETANLTEHTDQFFDTTATGNLVKATESLIALGEALPEDRSKYQQEAHRILERLLQERWDTPENMLINGDYGILVAPERKATNIQGWITHLLLQLDDTNLDM
jgi:rhamnogalacturonyl hydrolase YesR